MSKTLHSLNRKRLRERGKELSTLAFFYQNRIRFGTLNYQHRPFRKSTDLGLYSTDIAIGAGWIPASLFSAGLDHNMSASKGEH